MRGFSLLSIFFWVILLAAVLTVGLRLGPVYFQHYTLTKALHQVAQKHRAGPLNPVQMQQDFAKQRRIEGVDLAPEDFKVVYEASGAVFMTVQYTVQRPAIGNVDFLVHFDESVQVR